MNNADENIHSFLEGLGLDVKQVKIYLTLTKKGMMTTLELSRETGINRTRVYRLLEILKNKGFVEEVVDEHRKLAKAAAPDRLEVLVKDQETRVKFLRDFLPSFSHLLLVNSQIKQPGTKVLFYRGRDGILQQVWNTLRAKKEVVGYSYRPLVELIGDYYCKWREEWIRRKLAFRDVYSEEYFKGKKEKIEDSLTDKSKYFQSRYISVQILNINHQMDIYNDVVSLYNWHEGEIFGVEIYNEKIAKMQKQLFEIVWRMAVSR